MAIARIASLGIKAGTAGTGLMLLTVDLESYYSREYSLTRMTTAEYNLSPLFQPIMMALKVDSAPTEMLVGRDAIQARLNEIDPDQTALLSHNINFDGSILAWHFGFRPAMYLCTLSMARAITHWVLGKSSLAAISTFLGLPPKGDEVVRAIGKRLEAFTPAELASYSAYCQRDCDNARMAFDALLPYFTNAELAVIDLVARMFVLPQVQLDAGALAVHLADVQARKAEVLDRVSVLDPSIFSSQQRFAALLEEHGVEVPLKRSTATGEMIPALSKNDREFRELYEDPELPLAVQALLAARLSTKSTLEETRCQRLLTLSQLRWPDGAVGRLPVPLRYSAARTHRLGGDDKINLQNLTRGSPIRAGICAPPGQRIVHRDLSQIEARTVAWAAGCTPLLDAFRENRDVYCEFASSVYGLEVTPADKLRRFVGKTAILGLGYGCGADKFRHMLFIGNGGVSHKIDVTEAGEIVNHYREAYPQIPRLWRAGGGVLNQVIEVAPDDPPREISSQYFPRLRKHVPVRVGVDSVWLPSNMCLSYPGLHWENDEMFYKNAYGGEVKIYGAKFVENLSQALARIVVTDIALRVYDETGYHPFLTTHDSLDYCVPQDAVEHWNEYLAYQFSIVPIWAPGLPLASEGGWGLNLLSAERAENR